MNTQHKILGFSAGAALFITFLYLYPIQTQAPVQKAITVAPEPQKVEEKEISFTVLEQGELAPGAKNRKNYAIYTQEELDSFWKLSHVSDTSKAPQIDFTKKYVLVVFAGTQPSTGYEIRVTKVKDTEATRTIEVAMIVPGAGCKTKEEKTSPYQFVAVPYEVVSQLSHTDVTKTTDCKK